VAALTLMINGTTQRVDVDPDTPLLWVLRDHLGLTGTKYSCGIGACGACTVHLDGETARSCSIPVSDAVGSEITTIEGLGLQGLHPVQQAWIDEQVPQCGYCQPGQIMTAVAFLNHHSDPDEREIAAGMNDVLCRCGTYQRIRRAVARAAKEV
jgi:aerobic-type carbon monoxide dehydrogenase small subunit (CoxS/CutS family)